MLTLPPQKKIYRIYIVIKFHRVGKPLGEKSLKASFLRWVMIKLRKSELNFFSVVYLFWLYLLGALSQLFLLAFLEIFILALKV